MKVAILFLISHLLVAAAGFALGIYALPILIAEPAPSDETMMSAKRQIDFTAQVTPDQTGSDFLHWGDGTFYVNKAFVIFEGEIAPGPDYRLYLSPEPIYNEEDFLASRSTAVDIADIDTFGNFIVAVPDGVNTNRYRSAVIWCEHFEEFITAAIYR